MTKRMCLTVSSLAASICAAPALGAGTPIGKDLKATIALQGRPCDQVVTSKRNTDSDYTVTCKDGNKYHVFVDTSGRVVIEKQASRFISTWTNGLS
jgi:hypothetical protein